ncbi:MAG: glycosyltransferase family 4 protein [Clostridia bacterium]|nr:glycosyltransferase family 4 protein [Clostridia bacterium]
MNKITFLMLHLNYGGIEKQVSTLVNSLADQYEIEIISLYNILGKPFYKLDSRIKVRYIFDYGPNHKEIVQALKKFQVKKLFSELKKGLKILYTKFFRIGKIVDELDTDILISSRIEFSKQIKRKDIVVISQEHSYINTNQYKRKVKKSFKNVDYLIVMTERARELYETWFRECRERPRVVLIPNMISDYHGEGTNLHNKQIISVGRLEPVKDFTSLINVYSIIEKKHPDWCLKIIGEGSQREKLEKQILSLGLKDKVILTGRLTSDEIEHELDHSSIFLLTSKSESFSLVIVEAMAHNVPCVSYDIDVGPREIITNKEDGILVDDRNENQMAEEACMLIEDSVKRVEFGTKARKTAEKFFVSNISKEWKEFLDKLLEA